MTPTFDLTLRPAGQAALLSIPRLHDTAVSNGVDLQSLTAVCMAINAERVYKVVGVHVLRLYQ